MNRPHWTDSVTELPFWSVCPFLCVPLFAVFFNQMISSQASHWSLSLPPSHFETWKLEILTTWKLGNLETQKLKNSETVKLGNSETQKLGNSETRKPPPQNFFFVHFGVGATIRIGCLITAVPNQILLLRKGGTNIFYKSWDK